MKRFYSWLSRRAYKFAEWCARRSGYQALFSPILCAEHDGQWPDLLLKERPKPEPPLAPSVTVALNVAKRMAEQTDACPNSLMFETEPIRAYPDLPEPGDDVPKAKFPPVFSDALPVT